MSIMTNPEWRKRIDMFFTITMLLTPYLSACQSAPESNPQSTTNTPTPVPQPRPEKATSTPISTPEQSDLEEAISAEITEIVNLSPDNSFGFMLGFDQNQKASLEVFNHTSQVARFNPQAFKKIVALLYNRGGELPSQSQLHFIEEPNQSPGSVNDKKNIMIINPEALVYNPARFVPDGYTIQEVIQGIAVSQLCSLMLSEANMEYLVKDMPATKENIQYLCNSVGAMAVAASAGKTLAEYLNDAKTVFRLETEAGPQRLLSLDPRTFEEFQDALQEPILDFYSPIGDPA